MVIRVARPEDVPAVVACYEAGKVYMRANGNLTQWADGWPNEEAARRDMERGVLYVVCDEADVVHATFAFPIGADETYAVIEGGSWLSDSPYGTIHRLASDGVLHGVFDQVLAFCQGKLGHIRADTHADNHTVQHLLISHGFQHRGTIYVEDGTPRLAYEYCEDI